MIPGSGRSPVGRHGNQLQSACLGSSITKEPGRLQSMGLQKVRQVCKAPAYNAGRPGFDPWVGKILWRRQWQPTPVLLPGKSYGRMEPGRLQSVGSQRVGHDWATSLSLPLEQELPKKFDFSCLHMVFNRNFRSIWWIQGG